MITSTHNPKVQWVRSLQAQSKARRQEGLFVVEGVRLVEEALSAGWPARLVFYSQDLAPRGEEVVDTYRQRGSTVEQVAPNVLKAASDTENPQGVLAVLEKRVFDLPEQPDFILVLDTLRDPGNLGTILRTASAAGVQAVLLTRGSVDPFSPKVVRAAMGAHFRLPVMTMDWEAIRNYISSEVETRRQLGVFLADSHDGLPYDSALFSRPLAIIIGSEAEGAGAEAQALAAARVHIPLKRGAESLNAAVAAAVLLFEVVRQRSTAKKP